MMIEKIMVTAYCQEGVFTRTDDYYTDGSYDYTNNLVKTAVWREFVGYTVLSIVWSYA